MKKIAIFGAGGLGREIACIIRELNEKDKIWDFIGFFDDNPTLQGTKNEYGEILGGMDELNLWAEDLSIVIGVGNPKIVRKIVGSISNDKISFPNIIAPDVKFLDKDNFKIGIGNFFNFKGSVSCGVSVGNFNTFGGFSSLGHDCKIGDYNAIMPAVQLCGYVEIGSDNFFGVSSVVLQMQKVGKGVTLGAGSILMKDAENDSTYFGNPARKILKK